MRSSEGLLKGDAGWRRDCKKLCKCQCNLLSRRQVFILCQDLVECVAVEHIFSRTAPANPRSPFRVYSHPTRTLSLIRTSHSCNSGSATANRASSPGSAHPDAYFPNHRQRSRFSRRNRPDDLLLPALNMYRKELIGLLILNTFRMFLVPLRLGHRII